MPFGGRPHVVGFVQNLEEHFDEEEDDAEPFDAIVMSGVIGFGRASTDDAGAYRFRTIGPGRVPGPGNTLQASHLALSVFGRGILKRLATRLYFADDESLTDDPVLAAVPAERRATLIALRREDGTWWLDIVLQGPRETVFFDL